MNETLLQELLEETRQGNELLQKQLKNTRRLALVLAVLILLLAAAGLWVGYNLDRSLGQVDFEQLAAKVEEFDVQGLNRAVKSLDEQVAALDVPAINQSLAQIGQAAEGLEGSIESFAKFQKSMEKIFRW